MNASFQYLKSDEIAIYIKPPISPLAISYIQFFYLPPPAYIKFPHYLKVGFINTVEYEEKVVFKTQISSHFILYKMLTIEEFHDVNLKTIAVLQKSLRDNDNPLIKIYEVPIPLLSKTIEDVILSYELLNGLIIDIPID